MEKECKFCKKRIVVTQKNPNKKFCSETCKKNFNKEKIKERYRRYYLKNKEKIYRYTREWRKKNKKRFNENARIYQNKRRELLRRLIAQKCENCGDNKQLCIHHKDRNHFNNSPDNLMILCRKCHAEEHLKDRKRNSKGQFV